MPERDAGRSATDHHHPEPSDIELLEAVRRGQTSAFGELYRRHHVAAGRFARRLLHDPDLAADAVAEAFTRTFQAIRHGRGPTEVFLPYLLAAVRTSAARAATQRGRYELDADPIVVADEADLMADAADRAMILQAFAGLPERWRHVLRLTEVEQRSVTEVAAELGLSPNGVSALAFRAREALRASYLQAHLPASADPGCRRIVTKLGRFVRGSLGPRDACAVAAHLERCASCSRSVAELRDIAIAFEGARPTSAPSTEHARRRDRSARPLVGAGVAAVAAALVPLAVAAAPVAGASGATASADPPPASVATLPENLTERS
ncbi:MAG TPA: sigma-70 family RNA polymerase sigma factor [Aquihabitans sp.]|nr:sigma-70 family RNA polymerase sigma factor [Aquihabitans sp.]